MYVIQPNYLIRRYTICPTSEGLSCATDLYDLSIVPKEDHDLSPAPYRTPR